MENIICINCLNKDEIKTNDLKVKCSKCGGSINVLESKYLFNVDELYLCKLSGITKGYEYSDMYVLAYELAKIYIKEKDWKNAYKYLEFSAQSQYTKAINELGKCYLLGHGLENENAKKALDYFISAADLGNGEAAYNAAEILSDNTSLMNNDKSLEYLNKAGELGYLEAQKILAYYYEDMHRYFSCNTFYYGKNELFSANKPYHDLELAQYWYNKAAAQGDEESKEALDKYTDYVKDYVTSSDAFILSCAEYVNKSHWEFMYKLKSKIIVLGGSVKQSYSIGAIDTMEVLIYTGKNGLRKTPCYRKSTNFTMIYTSGNFLKGNFELLEGCIYIFNNWEKFPDKEAMLKNLKSKSDKIRNLLIEIGNSPKRGRAIEILLENNVLPYDILVEYSKLALSPSEGVLILNALEKSSDKTKKNYKVKEERENDLELGLSEYTIKEFKKVFNCVINDGVIELNKCNTTDETILLPASIEGANKYKFNSQQKNTYVKKIYFEEGITSIDISSSASSPLNKFVNLEEVHIPSTLEYVTPLLFHNAEFYTHDKSNPYIVNTEGTLLYVRGKEEIVDIVIPEGVKKITSSFFENLTKVKSVSLPSTIEEIEENAFKDCKKMASIKFTEKTNNSLVIGKFAFKNNFKVKEITLPEGTIFIDDFAFDLCKSLKTINLPSTLELLANSVFHKCKVLKEMKFTSDNDNFILEENALYSKGYIDLIQVFNSEETTSFTINKNVKNIKDSAFQEFINLANIELHEGLEEIGDSAFRKCHLLKDVVLPKSLKKIHFSAFRDCKSLEVIKVPEGIEDIGYAVFKGCESLYDVTLPESLEFINGLAFANCYSLKELELPIKTTHILSAFVDSKQIVLYTMLESAPEGWKCYDSYIACSNGLYFDNEVKYKEKLSKK
ncbi:MAG: leucine-rich repeat protein [bacterium]